MRNDTEYWGRNLKQTKILDASDLTNRLDYAASLIEKKNIQQTKSELQEILLVSPNSVAANYGMGEALFVSRDFTQALQYYKKALELATMHVGAHFSAGFIFHNIGLLEKSANHFMKVVQIKPDFIVAYKNLGIVLTKMGKFKEAHSVFSKATQLNPDSIDILAAQADLLDKEVDIESAFNLIVPALEHGRKHLDISLVFACICRHFDRCGNANDSPQELISTSTLNNTKKTELHFALGSLYDAREAYDTAFYHFEQVNRFQAYRFDPEKHTATISRLITTFSEDYLEQAPKATNESNMPVLIIGMPRSGISLVEHILCSHPEVYGAGELARMGEIVGQLSEGLYGRSVYPECFTSMTQETVDTLGNLYLDNLKDIASEKPIVTDKMPQNFQYLGHIALLLHGARIIHCHRNPLDNCLSIYFQHFLGNIKFANNLNHFGWCYREYQQLMDHWYSVFDLPVLEIQYVSLVDDHELWARHLVEFVGLEWDKNCLNYHKNPRQPRTRNYDQVRQPIYSSSVGRWHHYQIYRPTEKALESN